MPSKKNILLITPDTMMSVDGGSIFFKSLLPHLSAFNVVWFAAGGRNKKTPEWMAPYTSYRETSVIFQRYVVSILRRSNVLINIWTFLCYRWFVKRLISTADGIIKTEKIDKIWIVGTMHLLPLGAALRRMTNIPVHVTMHDDIDRLPAAERERLTPDFVDLLKNADSIDTICQSMADYYREKYHISRHFEVMTVGGDTIPLPSAPEIKPTITSIGYAGSIIYTEGFDTLLECLNIMNGTRPEREQIQLHVYTYNYPPAKRQGKYLNIHATLPMEEFYQRMQTHDLLFVTMPFAEKNASFCRTSFPSKLIAYLKAQLPILALGPEYATNVEFVNKYGVGVSCIHNDAGTLAAKIEEYESGLEQRRSASRRCRETFQAEYQSEKMARKFESIVLNFEK